MTDEIKVPFVCVHNAARSPMAEALLRTFTGSHTEKLARIAEVRDAIAQQLRTWMQMLPATSRRVRT